MPRAMITSVLLLVSLEAANADLRIVSSGGGEVGSHLRLFAAIRQSGQRAIIDGPCLSACSLVLSAIPGGGRGGNRRRKSRTFLAWRFGDRCPSLLTRRAG